MNKNKKVLLCTVLFVVYSYMPILSYEKLYSAKEKTAKNVAQSSVLSYLVYLFSIFSLEIIYVQNFDNLLVQLAR